MLLLGEIVQEKDHNIVAQHHPLFEDFPTFFLFLEKLQILI